MRGFDERFKARIEDSELLERVTRAPIGTRASVRSVEFVKDTRTRWHNAFRANITNREVASVLSEGTHTIVE